MKTNINAYVNNSMNNIIRIKSSTVIDYKQFKQQLSDLIVSLCVPDWQRTEKQISIIAAFLDNIKIYGKGIYNSQNRKWNQMKQTLAQKFSIEFFEPKQDITNIIYKHGFSKLCILLDGCLKFQNIQKLEQNDYLGQETHEIINYSTVLKYSDFGEVFGPSYDQDFQVIRAGEKPCILMTLTKQDYQSYIMETQKDLIQMNIDFLKTEFSLFRNLDEEFLEELIRNNPVIQFKQNSILYKENQNHPYVYLIQKGEIQYIKSFDTSEYNQQQLKNRGPKKESKLQKQNNSKQSQNRQQKQLRLLIVGRNNLIGYEEILQNKAKQFTIQCISETVDVLKFSKAAFLNYVYPNAQKSLEKQSQQKHQQLQQRIQNIVNIRQEYKHYLQELFEINRNDYQTKIIEKYKYNIKVYDPMELFNLRKEIKEQEEYQKLQKKSFKFRKKKKNKKNQKNKNTFNNNDTFDNENQNGIEKGFIVNLCNQFIKSKKIKKSLIPVQKLKKTKSQLQNDNDGNNKISFNKFTKNMKFGNQRYQKYWRQFIPSQSLPQNTVFHIVNKLNTGQFKSKFRIRDPESYDKSQQTSQLNNNNQETESQQNNNIQQSLHSTLNNSATNSNSQSITRPLFPTKNQINDIEKEKLLKIFDKLPQKQQNFHSFHHSSLSPNKLLQGAQYDQNKQLKSNHLQKIPFGGSRCPYLIGAEDTESNPGDISLNFGTMKNNISKIVNHQKSLYDYKLFPQKIGIFIDNQKKQQQQGNQISQNNNNSMLKDIFPQLQQQQQLNKNNNNKNGKHIHPPFNQSDPYFFLQKNIKNSLEQIEETHNLNLNNTSSPLKYHKKQPKKTNNNLQFLKSQNICLRKKQHLEKPSSDYLSPQSSKQATQISFPNFSNSPQNLQDSIQQQQQQQQQQQLQQQIQSQQFLSQRNQSKFQQFQHFINEYSLPNSHANSVYNTHNNSAQHSIQNLPSQLNLNQSNAQSTKNEKLNFKQKKIQEKQEEIDFHTNKLRKIMELEKTKNEHYRNERFIRKKLLPTVEDQIWLEKFLIKQLHIKPKPQEIQYCLDNLEQKPLHVRELPFINIQNMDQIDKSNSENNNNNNNLYSPTPANRIQKKQHQNKFHHSNTTKKLKMTIPEDDHEYQPTSNTSRFAYSSAHKNQKSPYKLYNYTTNYNSPTSQLTNTSSKLHYQQQQSPQQQKLNLDIHKINKQQSSSFNRSPTNNRSKQGSLTLQQKLLQEEDPHMYMTPKKIIEASRQYFSSAIILQQSQSNRSNNNNTNLNNIQQENSSLIRNFQFQSPQHSPHTLSRICTLQQKYQPQKQKSKEISNDDDEDTTTSHKNVKKIGMQLSNQYSKEFKSKINQYLQRKKIASSPYQNDSNNSSSQLQSQTLSSSSTLSDESYQLKLNQQNKKQKNVNFIKKNTQNVSYQRKSFGTQAANQSKKIISYCERHIPKKYMKVFSKQDQKQVRKAFEDSINEGDKPQDGQKIDLTKLKLFSTSKNAEEIIQSSNQMSLIRKKKHMNTINKDIEDILSKKNLSEKSSNLLLQRKSKKSIITENNINGALSRLQSLQGSQNNLQSFQSSTKFKKERKKMVQTQIIPHQIHNSRFVPISNQYNSLQASSNSLSQQQQQYQNQNDDGEDDYEISD